MRKLRLAIIGCCLFVASHVVAAEMGSGATCGGIAGTQCSASGEYCDFGVGQCKTADAAGVCKTKPEICTEQHDPVCGCDGTTYDNPCKAARSGESIDHKGKCKKK